VNSLSSRDRPTTHTESLRLAGANKTNYIFYTILNWLISFLTGRNHTTKTSVGESTPAFINRSIVQGSGLGPTLYLILECDLKPKSSINKIFKYADDTNLLVPTQS